MSGRRAGRVDTCTSISVCVCVVHVSNKATDSEWSDGSGDPNLFDIQCIQTVRRLVKPLMRLNRSFSQEHGA